MKSFLQGPNSKQRYSKAFEWVKLISVTGSVQVIVSALSFISGIMVVRLLAPEEYALYTLANTMLGTMVILADGGITNGVMALGAKVHDDRLKLGVVMATGFNLRRKFAAGSLLIATPILLYFLRDNGASWILSILIILSLIPAFFTSLSGNILEIVAKIKQDIMPLQKIKVVSNVGRLGLLSITIFLFPWAFIAILASGIPQIWANWKMRKNSDKFADFQQVPDPLVAKQILKIVKRILPGAVYFSISGQINVWLISVFGSTKQIADVGVLDRLSMVLTVFSVLFFTLVTPRYAKLPNNPKILFNRLIQIQFLLAILSVLIIGTVWLFSTQALWILGPNYADLHIELVINIASSCVGMVAAFTYSLFTNRGWNINPLFSIPLNIATIAVGAFIANEWIGLNKLTGVLTLNLFINVVYLFTNVIYILMRIKKIKA